MDILGTFYNVLNVSGNFCINATIFSVAVHDQKNKYAYCLWLFIIRWLGPKRYELSGAKTLLDNKMYEGKVSFVMNKINATDPTDVGNPCLYRCPTCERVSHVLNEEHEAFAQNAPGRHNEFSTEDELSIQSIEGQFMSVTGAVMSCMSPNSPKGITPSAHLGDGNLDLILVRKTSRLNYLRYLIRTSMPSATNSPFQLPFVQVYRVKEFTFHPKESLNLDSDDGGSDGTKIAKSVWNCDGELISSSCIRGKVHCQVLPVFARGIE